MILALQGHSGDGSFRSIARAACLGTATARQCPKPSQKLVTMQENIAPVLDLIEGYTGQIAGQVGQT